MIKKHIVGIMVGAALGAVVVALVFVFVINADDDSSSQTARQNADYDYCFLVNVSPYGGQGVATLNTYDAQGTVLLSIEGITTFETREQALATLAQYEGATEGTSYQWGGCAQYGEINDVIERNKFTYCELILGNDGDPWAARFGGEVFETRQAAEEYLASPDRNTVFDNYAQHTIWCNR